MEISCAFPPGPHVVDHIVEAERLGYERAWLFDSPALYGDIWVIAALAAQRTSRIALGPAVLVPNLRHPLTQASAIATLEQLAPGRVVVAIGTGFTGRMAMGQKPLTWACTRALHRAAARAAARREGRGRRRDRADVARPRVRAAVPDPNADRRRRQRAEGHGGRARVRRRRDDDRRRRARLRLVLGARVRHRARRRARARAPSARSRPPGPRSPSCTTRCTKAIPRRSTRCRAGSSGASGSRRFPKPNVTSRSTKSIS